MNDPNKYARLFGLLFLSALAFIITLVLLFLGMRLIFGLLNYMPWLTYVYTIVILAVPAAIFFTAFLIFFSRTKSHPSKPVRIISYTLFVLFLATWGLVFVIDMLDFFKKGRPQIEYYTSWNIFFLTASIACLFIVGVIQALSTRKEEDWLERYKRNNL
jgi:hypothetical protein